MLRRWRLVLRRLALLHLPLLSSVLLFKLLRLLCVALLHLLFLLVVVVFLHGLLMLFFLLLLQLLVLLRLLGGQLVLLLLIFLVGIGIPSGWRRVFVRLQVGGIVRRIRCRGLVFAARFSSGHDAGLEVARS